MLHRIPALLGPLFLLAAGLAAGLSAAPPMVGDKAPDFTLKALDGQEVTLSREAARGPLALIVLRGFPGYQCPLCNRQVQDLVRSAAAFKDAGVRVLMVYPGPAAGLNERAAEFTADKNLPAHFQLVTDPDYTFTNQYQLRWDAPKETAYPSTFLLRPDGTIFFAKISNSHGGRTTAAELLTEFQKSH